jgi:hypothetical protein
VIAAILLAAALDLTVSARSQRPGEIVVLTIRTTASAHALHVRAFDRAVVPFQVDPHTWRAIIGIDLDVAPGRYTVSVDADPGAAHATLALVVVAREFRSSWLRGNSGPAR